MHGLHVLMPWLHPAVPGTQLAAAACTAHALQAEAWPQKGGPEGLLCRWWALQATR